MSALESAALWVGLNTLLLVFVSLQVGRARIKTGISFGDDANEEMQKAIRTQGNYIEYAPAAVSGLILMALLGGTSVVIHVFGAVFFFSRVAHVLGLGMNVWSKGRLVGTLGTMFTLLGTGLYLIYLAIS